MLQRRASRLFLLNRGARAPIARAITRASSDDAHAAPFPAVTDVKTPSELDAMVPKSHSQAIIFDFYADWCGPCKTLTPMLERAVEKVWPKAALVKLNTDSPALAPVVEQLRISSLPTVMGMVGGKFVDQFKGAIPEAEVEKFVAQLVSGLEETTAVGEGSTGDGSAAADYGVGLDAATAAVFGGVGTLEESVRTHVATVLTGVLNARETGPEMKCRAFAASAMLALRSDPMDVAGAEELLAAGKKLVDGFTEPKEMAMVEARLELSRDVAIGDDLEARKAAHEAEPKNFENLRALALALYAAGDSEGACETALKSVKPSFGSQDVREEGKKLVVRLIDAVGSGTPLAEATRKRLSNLWFL
jgi:putative thioredoxin